ncbi:zinc metallopeptidase, M23 family [Arcobacter venerupis]|uniref:Zinc metallopeptidase, M23 family n=1 Tax=Arcobacter venerupis TaxID=1054033 RepID=A0AAE7BD67_9BACT|nr:M23 family metallopeptidase [Arcobacter venerupis]QKF68239.1 zinc metallopeptidase, M23 family [Arcobacter venerupis]
MKFTNNKNGKVFWIFIILLILVMALIAFLFLSPTFERVAPKISIDKEIYWNLQKPIKVEITDNNDIKSYDIIYDDGQKQTKLETKVTKSEKGLIELEILPPSFNEMQKPKDGNIKIDVYDVSKWNFFRGNQSVTTSKVIIDKKSPVANVIANSYLLRQGGSGVVIVEVSDENLKDYYISFNDEELFELFPFYKKNYYIAIITWPVKIKEFSRVNLVAVDMAGNKSVAKVPFYIKSFQEKDDDIKVSDDFIQNVAKQVLEKSDVNIPTDPVDIFLKTNKEVREKNIKTIRDVTRKNFSNNLVTSYDLKTFLRLENSATVAGYGERRSYFYNDQKVDEEWHLGMDWASVKRAPIKTYNDGKVIFKDYLGIYGNSIIIDHGIGLATLYAHTSSANVELNDEVKAGQQIGNTGSTGAVFGDHLHFGVLVQGIEVNPNEWQTKDWISTNVTKTINDAVKVINTK